MLQVVLLGMKVHLLQKLLEERYFEFFIEPKLKVRIAEFKSLRVLVQGEVRYPGLYKFPAYKSDFLLKINPNINKSEKNIPNDMTESSNQLMNQLIS